MRCSSRAAARATRSTGTAGRHDKVVRSTHGVNCTGSCSWKVYVKDGIITWETQQTDYPSVGPDSPEYEPRGCPRGAAFSWYTYSPTRVRYPYVRGALLRAVPRPPRQRTGDPVLAWAEVTGDPETARSYKSARGKGGLSAPPGTRPRRSSPRRTCTPSRRTAPTASRGSPRSPRCRWCRTAAGARFVSTARRHDAVVLRLVRRPARRVARRCSATRRTSRSPPTGGTRATS